MRIIRDFSVCPSECRGAALALGNFDGVHRGHQAILNQCFSIAKKEKAPSAVMTFEPHPREFFGKKTLRITSFRRKAELLKSLGIDVLFVMRFNRRTSSLSAGSFVRDILHKQLAVRHVITGENFAFGKDRRGNTAYLAEEAQKLGFGFSSCAPVVDAGGEIISSSAIRAHLATGEVKEAQTLLGRPYDITGHVRHGDKRGRELGFPTMNLSLARLCKPRFGIYAVRMRLGKEKYDGVASLGVRPTFGTNEPLLEVHAFGMNRSAYGERLRVEFVEFIRDEARFNTPEILRAQMEKDSRRAKELLNER